MPLSILSLESSQDSRIGFDRGNLLCSGKLLLLDPQLAGEGIQLDPQTHLKAELSLVEHLRLQIHRSDLREHAIGLLPPLPRPPRERFVARGFPALCSLPLQILPTKAVENIATARRGRLCESTTLRLSLSEERNATYFMKKD
jgi:hypothetical protein